ncbi:TetR/AcrR family transcriptional regulator [Alkalihalobacterium alkalinitrilicum]|uniref:TetR/AcrR family transcriptional regulator n=1 Tax=Alkalihalobacterium alkalinitrilicum TaxID=427920 RepID=UPI0013034839|nr:TetR/AcrR family transcriptional regulator [Alkalihalobacterium alkalinitrilicum]
MSDIISHRSKPKTERGRITKLKLIEAAEGVFGELGFFQAGITDITREAGVALGTFYTYFQSKEEIFKDLVTFRLHELKKEIALETHGITDRLDLERKGLKVFFKFIQKHPFHYRLMRQSEFVDEKFHRKIYESFAAGYIRSLSKSMANKQIRKIDPEILVYCFMGISDYIGMRWVLWEKTEVDDRIIDELMTFISHGIANSQIPDLNKYIPDNSDLSIEYT